VKRSDISVILGYSLLAFVMTYPLALNLRSLIPGGTDAYWYLWNFWWFDKAVVGMHVNPLLHNPMFFYPKGLLMAITELSPYNSFISIPLQELFGSIAAYNLLLISSFILSGYGMFLLVRYLISDSYASFISGIIYSFSSYHFVEAFGISADRPQGHLNLATMQWIPLYVLCLLKLVKDPNPKNALLCALFFFLSSMATWQYMGFLVLFTGLYILYLLRSERKRLTKDFAVYFGLSIFLTFMLLFPLAYPILSQSLRVDYMSSDIATIAYFSADLMDFIIPGQLNPVFGRYSLEFHESLFQKSLLYGYPSFWFYDCNFLGWTATALALYYIIIIRRIGLGLYSNITNLFIKASKIRKKDLVLLPVLFFGAILPLYILSGGIETYIIIMTYSSIILLAYYLLKNEKPDFWLISLLFFITLSLGPLLHIFGRYEYGPSKLLLFLPYTFFYYTVPLFTVFRVPARLTVMVLLSMSVIGGYSLKILAQKYGKRIYLVAAVLVLFEAAAMPFFQTAIVPDIYAQISKEQGDYAILDIPLSFEEPTHRFLYYQTVHGKRIIEGYAPKPPGEILDYYFNSPVISDLFLLRGNRTLLSLDDGSLRVDKYADLRPPANDLVMVKRFLENETPSGDSYVASWYPLHDSSVYGINRLTLQTYPLKDIVTQNISEMGNDVLKYYNVRYIILHKSFLSPEEMEAAETLLKSIQKTVFYEDLHLKMYLLKDQDYKKRAFIYLGGGWGPLDAFSEKPARKIVNQESTVNLISYGSQAHIISFSFNATSNEPENLQVSLNGKYKGSFYITSEEKQFTTDLEGTLTGENTILFQARRKNSGIELRDIRLIEL
jgi:hypothetical protein